MPDDRLQTAHGERFPFVQWHPCAASVCGTSLQDPGSRRRLRCHHPNTGTGQCRPLRRHRIRAVALSSSWPSVLALVGRQQPFIFWG